MISRQQLKCFFCGSCATRVCCSQKCIRFPFICSDLCVDNKSIPQQIHDHENNSTIKVISAQSLNQLINDILDGDVKQILNQAARQVEELKQNLESMFKQYQLAFTKKYVHQITQQARKVIDKLKQIGTSTNTLTGQQIFILQSKQRIYKDYINIQKYRKNYQDQFTKIVDKFRNQSKELTLKFKEGIQRQEISETVHQEQTQASKQKKNYFIIGKRAQSNNKFDKAIEYYKKALQNDSLNHQIYCEMGKCAIKMKRFTLATRSFKKSIEMNPNYVAGYYQHASMYLLQQKYSHAIDRFKKAYHLDSTNPIYPFKIGLCENKMKKYDNALKSLNSAVELGIQDSDCFFEMGKSYHHLKRYQQSIQYYSKAIQRSNTNSDYYLKRGIAYKALSMDDKASQDYQFYQIKKDILEKQKQKILKRQQENKYE